MLKGIPEPPGDVLGFLQKIPEQTIGWQILTPVSSIAPPALLAAGLLAALLCAAVIRPYQG